MIFQYQDIYEPEGALTRDVGSARMLPLCGWLSGLVDYHNVESNQSWGQDRPAMGRTIRREISPCLARFVFSSE